jgi:hypothetical protein
LRFFCKTLFDITATGVTGHFKSSRIPFRDRSGKNIVDEITWNQARNQQRNWETLTQLLSMRTQIFEIEVPKKHHEIWSFEFEVDTPGVFGTPEHPVEMLLLDAEGIPMLLGLENTYDLLPVLITDGEDQNIWFDYLT